MTNTATRNAIADAQGRAMALANICQADPALAAEAQSILAAADMVPERMLDDFAAKLEGVGSEISNETLEGIVEPVDHAKLIGQLEAACRHAVARVDVEAGRMRRHLDGIRLANWLDACDRLAALTHRPPGARPENRLSDGLETHSGPSHTPRPAPEQPARHLWRETGGPAHQKVD